MRGMTSLLILLVVLGAAVGGWYGADAAKTPPALHLTLEAPGASVFLDGRFRGLADGEGALTLPRVVPGAHLLEVTAAGYEPFSKRLLVENEATLPVSLEPIPVATVTVDTVPPGAQVLVDGRARGRTPLRLRGVAAGRYVLRLSRTNYIGRRLEVDVEAGVDKTVMVPLKHQQVQAYRARLQRNPADIAAYNDLGELLFVLARYREAAEVFVDGMVAASGPLKDGVDHRNAHKLKHEARQKHRHPEFDKAFDDFVLRRVSAGENAQFLYEQFLQLARKDPERGLEAMRGLIRAHPENTRYPLDLIQYYAQRLDVDTLKPEVEAFLRREKLQPADLRRLGELLITGYTRCRSKKRDDFRPLLASAFSAMREFDGQDKDPNYLYLEVRYARILDDAAGVMKYLPSAIEAQRDVRRRCRWQMELVKAYEAAGELEKAVALCRVVSEEKGAHANEKKHAKTVLKRIERRLEKIRKREDQARFEQERLRRRDAGERMRLAREREKALAAEARRKAEEEARREAEAAAKQTVEAAEEEDAPSAEDAAAEEPKAGPAAEDTAP